MFNQGFNQILLILTDTSISQKIIVTDLYRYLNNPHIELYILNFK